MNHAFKKREALNDIYWVFLDFNIILLKVDFCQMLTFASATGGDQKTEENCNKKVNLKGHFVSTFKLAYLIVKIENQHLHFVPVGFY